MAFSDEARAKAAETRKRNAEARKSEIVHNDGARLRSTGVGESKIFRDPNAPDPYAHIRECHIQGKRIGDIFNDAQIQFLSYAHTDEGIEERNSGKEASTASVTRDEFTGACMERRDSIKERGMQPWQAPDPLKEVAEAHVAPGMTPRFLSPKKIDSHGLRGFEIVRDASGNPVKVRDMVLGQMPKENAKQRNESYRRKATDALKEIERLASRDGLESD